MRSVSRKPYSSLLVNIEDVLSQLHGVRPSGADKWTALCPAHPDKNPSLSIKRDGDRILLHCFAGCSFVDICAACRLVFGNSKDLDRPTARRGHLRGTLHLNTYSQSMRRRLSQHALALSLRADSILSCARGLDCSDWTSRDFDTALTAVTQAYTDLQRSDLLRHLAFHIGKAEPGGKETR